GQRYYCITGFPCSLDFKRGTCTKVFPLVIIAQSHYETPYGSFVVVCLSHHLTSSTDEFFSALARWGSRCVGNGGQGYPDVDTVLSESRQSDWCGDGDLPGRWLWKPCPP